MSNLRKSLEEYLAVRRALGFKLKTPGLLLHQFVNFAEAERSPFITRSLALNWATQSSNCRPVYWEYRLSQVRRFAEYQSAIDQRTEIPPSGLWPQGTHKKIPFIYSDSDIERLLASAKQLHSRLGLEGTTYSVFFGLLAVTGMRVSEVVKLNCADVDLSDCILTIQLTKFDKSRLIPLHKSTCGVLRGYAALRDRILPGRATPAFFVSEQGTRLNYSAIWRMYVKLTRKIGLQSGTGSGPRIHDFRHRFAIRTLCQFYRDGQDVEYRLPTLATYLGHVNIASTYWYLSAVPELLLLAAKRVNDQPQEVKS
jgi:integrase/recombinase XerD